MKVALAQVNTTVGDVEGNVARLHQPSRAWSCSEEEEGEACLAPYREES